MKWTTLPCILMACSPFFQASLAITLTDPSQLQTTTYDYVIVGAGTSGLALASRLSENTGITVLVLEAGVSDEGVVPVMAPFLGPTVTPGTPYDWNYTVIPQSGLDGRTFPYPRGRILGGSSSANYLIHQYGSNENWDRMARVSMDPGWGWDNMKKYIERHEKFVPPLDGHNTSDQFIPSLHSYTGMLDVTLYSVSQPIDARVIETTTQLKEFPYNEDISGIDNDLLGIGWAQSSMGSGDRASSSTSYLASANSRPNLTVLINAMVTKLLPTGSEDGLQSFRNVQFSDSRTQSTTPSFQVQATKEVILSAGSIGTVQILQLSGIGDSADLKPLGIPVLIDNPLVGKNLQDHPLLPNIFTVQDGAGSLDGTLRNQTLVQDAVAEWETKKTGFISNNVINNLGFARLHPKLLEDFPDPSAGSSTPHFEIIFANYWLDPVINRPPIGSFLTILTAVLTPTSRGTVTISSTNPFDAPLINPNMLATPFDIKIMRESIRAIKRFAAAPAWSDYITGTYRNLFVETDEEIDAYARQYTSTVFHPTSTASMTSHTSSNGVVNPDLTVKGTIGLRIVDLSVLPFIPSCHPQGSAYLIAERAADLLKGAQSDYMDDMAPQYVIT